MKHIPALKFAATAVVFAALAGAGFWLVGRRAPSSPATGQVTFSFRLSAALVSTPPSEVAYAVRTPGGAVVNEGRLSVTNPQAPLSRTLALPVGSGNTIAFTASIAGAAPVSLGTASFDVAAGRAAEIHLDGVIPPGSAAPGPSASAPATASAPTGGVPAAARPKVDSTAACRACQLASTARFCDPVNLTATAQANPQTGEETAVGWGCETLPNDAARAACHDLLQCLNAHPCAGSGQNPAMGCYCGGAEPNDCIVGEGVTGACAAQFQAAAAPSAGGPSANASVAQISTFIAESASNPRTAVGLADNLKRCAIDARCDSCGLL